MTTVVFDLDGTLVDSAPDIRAAANRMLADQGLEPLDLPTIISFVGNGLPKLVERVMQARGLDMADHPRLSQLTLDHYNAAASDLSALYPGVRIALERLRVQGYTLGLCTNKPEAPARHILDHFGLSDLFLVVVGGDTLAVKKPDPAHLLRTFDQLPEGPRVYVGDSEVDAETAHRAGVPFLLFTEGYRKTPAEALPHSARFSDFAALPDLIATLPQRKSA
ncbi:phosphoglycolate phosphatase [Seohaeicola saemankumensis]|nr:phosphoglycolate phosphatase [Seohaeicola saemankumensis]MCA0871202.1 phosphoglycolate phosphatase [Seohaeicola saemankumensis]